MAKKKTAAQEAMAKVISRTGKFDKSALDRKKMNDIYGVRHFISTGLPSLDLNLFWRRNKDGTASCGMPAGRFVEIHGSSESGKTLIANQIMARCVASGGLAFKVTSERDYDMSWEDEIFYAEGVDPEDVEALTGYMTASNVSQLKYGFDNFVNGIAEVLPDDGTAPPTAFIVDSVAEMLGDDDYKSLQSAAIVGDKSRKDRLNEHGVLEDATVRPGNHAFHFKKFFKIASEPVHLYNILFLMMNQMRANIDTGRSFGPSDKPAHDGTMQYISSARLGITRYGSIGKFTKNNRSYDLGWNVLVQIKKHRGKRVQDGKVWLVLRADSTFDYLYSLIDALGISGLARQVGSDKYLKASWTFQTDQEFLYKEDLLPFMEEYDKLKTNALRKELLKPENAEIVAKLERAVIDLGPLYADIENQEVSR